MLLICIDRRYLISRRKIMGRPSFGRTAKMAHFSVTIFQPPRVPLASHPRKFSRKCVFLKKEFSRARRAMPAGFSNIYIPAILRPWWRWYGPRCRPGAAKIRLPLVRVSGLFFLASCVPQHCTQRAVANCGAQKRSRSSAKAPDSRST